MAFLRFYVAKLQTGATTVFYVSILRKYFTNVDCPRRGTHALEWITPWPTEPVRVTGVTDVVIPAMRSWPGHDAAKVVTRPIVRHGVTMRQPHGCFGLLFGLSVLRVIGNRRQLGQHLGVLNLDAFLGFTFSRLDEVADQFEHVNRVFDFSPFGF